MERTRLVEWRSHLIQGKAASLRSPLGLSRTQSDSSSLSPDSPQFLRPSRTLTLVALPLSSDPLQSFCLLGPAIFYVGMPKGLVQDSEDVKEGSNFPRLKEERGMWNTVRKDK